MMFWVWLGIMVIMGLLLVAGLATAADEWENKKEV